MKNKFDLSSMPDQSDRIAIVTGANIGLGYETAIGLAKKGAKVVMACRNLEKAGEARKMISAAVPGADLDIIPLDLSSKKSIEAFAVEYQERYDHVDLLINNAGIMIPPYLETEDGFESQWGINHLGHFYLTGLLYGCLYKSKSARVVSLASLAHFAGKIDFEDPNRKTSYKPMESYRQSKLACLVFAYELQRRLDKKGSSMKSLAAHPGVALTNLLASGPKWVKFLAPLFSWLLHSVKDGAESTLMAALDPTLEGGEYIGPMGRRGMKGVPGITYSNSLSKDLEVGRKLWDLSEELLGFKFEV